MGRKNECIEHTPFACKTASVSGRTKFVECVLLNCDHPATSEGDGRGPDGPGLDENLTTGK